MNAYCNHKRRPKIVFKSPIVCEKGGVDKASVLLVLSNKVSLEVIAFHFFFEIELHFTFEFEVIAIIKVDVRLIFFLKIW